MLCEKYKTFIPFITVWGNANMGSDFPNGVAG